MQQIVIFISIYQSNLSDYDAYKTFSENVSNILKENGLNVLFNNAGYSSKYTRIQYVKAEHLLTAFHTNTIAPIMLTKALLPQLKRAAEKNEKVHMGVQKAVIINMSSILASIDGNRDGGLYPYKCSKAALNMATTSMAIDLKNDGILVTSLHPGWVQTDMGGSKAPMDVDSSCNSLINLLYDLNESHNGGFFQWDGKKLAW